MAQLKFKPNYKEGRALFIMFLLWFVIPLIVLVVLVGSH